MTSIDTQKSSIVVIGAGIAGIFTALQLAPLKVLILTAGRVDKRSSSLWAQGGLAAAIGGDDSADLHYHDTIAVGGGLVVPAAACRLAEAAAARVQDLIDLGVDFDRTGEGVLKLGREAAHSRNRIVHASGDRTGAVIMGALIDRVRRAAHITLKERCIAEDILVTDGICRGVLAYDVTARSRIAFSADQVILATGGIGGLYAVTTNPVQAQGHGIAMALRAGASIIDPEFTQFHPTALDSDQDPAPLATEALRGEGSILIDGSGNRFMTAMHPDTELAPRDIVAKGVARAIRETGGAFLDTRKAIGGRMAQKYPTVYAAAMEAGIDPVTRPLPVRPALHYHMGGVGINHAGQSDIEGLWAIGEVASSGVHGANRLASNSLLEALVYGANCALAIKNTSPSRRTSSAGAAPLPEDRLALAPKPAPPALLKALRTVMSRNCGILRTAAELHSALEFVARMDSDPDFTSGLKNTLLCAKAIIIAALNRCESRGAHERLDYPDTAPEILPERIYTPAHSVIRLVQDAVQVTRGPHPADPLSTTVPSDHPDRAGRH